MTVEVADGALFHINGRGEAARCGARTRDCRFGTVAEHFKTFDEARFEFESWMVEMTIPAPIRKTAQFRSEFGAVVEQSREQAAMVVQRDVSTLPSRLTLPPLHVVVSEASRGAAFVLDDDDPFNGMLADFLD